MFYKVMQPRNHNEHHRVATPLELYFDLVYVVAIAAVAGGLHHALAAHHFATGIWTFGISLFAVWWAWMNFTWFASAYDTDDVAYRIATMIQMFGSLILAIGITDVFEQESFSLMIVGYIVMRFALVYQWLRAAKSDRARSVTCLRYAIGISLVQIAWGVMLFLPPAIMSYWLIVFIFAELAVPVWAEKAESTTWHPHHIAERYSLLTIIVLGEGILGAANAIAPLMHTEIRWLTQAFPLGLGISALMFSLWWLYFKMPWATLLEHNRRVRIAVLYGYGHYFIFGALIAVGAGLELVADSVKASVQNVTHSAQEHSVSPFLAMSVVSFSLAIYLSVVTLLRARLNQGACNYHIIGYVFALALTALSVLAVYFGMPLQWAIWFSVISPVAMIMLYQENQ
ncbi:low temperature requirement protein A [Spirabiliibacterium falconis]|uniref:low temperature requirement protein A n=1 Tax=Spirabiliibacterium falconis TaxID=572023 RepID=UPI001AADAA6A|nr:low temperature requirement protein A [Spirabiliibacterium falconis]MBE2894290.1 low temperature requirement protein A [Spirabiliibacterium falconis]